jgi:hypothetical protein
MLKNSEFLGVCFSGKSENILYSLEYSLVTSPVDLYDGIVDDRSPPVFKNI